MAGYGAFAGDIGQPSGGVVARRVLEAEAPVPFLQVESDALHIQREGGFSHQSRNRYALGRDPAAQQLCYRELIGTRTHVKVADVKHLAYSG